MAVTYYVDFIDGSNSNNGTTTSTPFKDFDAFDALSWTSGDEIKCRGISGTSISENLAWVYGSSTITTVGDLTSELSAGDYITKTNDLKQVYEILSINATTITFKFWNAANKYAFDTETVSSTKLEPFIVSLLGEIQMNKNGFSTGDRTLITGGWNVDYTTQDEYTVWDATGKEPFGNSLNYYDINKFIILNHDGIDMDNCDFTDFMVGHNTLKGFEAALSCNFTNIYIIGCDHSGFNNCDVCVYNDIFITDTDVYAMTNCGDCIISGMTIDYCFNRAIAGPLDSFYYDIDIKNITIGFSAGSGNYGENINFTNVTNDLFTDVSGVFYNITNDTANSDFNLNNNLKIYNYSGQNIDIDGCYNFEIYSSDVITINANSPDNVTISIQDFEIKYNKAINIETTNTDVYTGTTAVKIYGDNTKDGFLTQIDLLSLPVTSGVSNTISFYTKHLDSNFTGELKWRIRDNSATPTSWNDITLVEAWTERTDTITPVSDYITIELYAAPTYNGDWALNADKFTVST
jgi:hypothetical protein